MQVQDDATLERDELVHVVGSHVEAQRHSYMIRLKGPCHTPM